MCIWFASAVIIVVCGIQEAVSDPKCNNVTNVVRSLDLEINSRKNESGDWVTTFSAWKDSKNPSNILRLDVNHKMVECEGRHIVYIRGLINETPFEYGDQPLLFHPNCGKNAAISNDGRTVRKLKLDDPLNGVVLTNRPLKNNELFEVRLDQKNTKFQYTYGIGITVNSPFGFSIPNHMYAMRSGNWMYYHSNIDKDGAKFFPNYGHNLDELVVGDRVGVLRNNFGTLHFFVNGVDQGPAASNIPNPIYGVFELYHNAVQGTIVDSTVP